MKMNYSLMLGLLVAVSATAQEATNSLPAIPAPANVTTIAAAPPAAVETPTNAPAKKTVKHKKKKPAKVAARVEAATVSRNIFSEAAVTLVPGPAEVCVTNLNVRGQAGLKGEVVAHVQKGDTVTVLGEINLDKHKADEPAQWAKIALPAGVDVWVRSSFIDSKDKTVSPNKLNLRAGPSEDYSVLGVIERGTTVTEVGAKGEWTKIEAPTNAFAFIAAMYLKQELSGNAPTNFAPSTEIPVSPETNNIPTTSMTVTEPSPAPETTPVAPDTNSVVPAPAPTTDTNAPAVTDTNAVPAVDTNLPPPPPRVVTHEGVVRSSSSLVAPTYFELYDPATDNAIDYLYSTTTNLNLSRYDGFKIVVTGEEGLDARWKDTPVLTIQRIYVLSTNVPPTPILKSPRASTAH